MTLGYSVDFFKQVLASHKHKARGYWLGTCSILFLLAAIVKTLDCYNNCTRSNNLDP